MATPTDKNPELVKALDIWFGVERNKSITQDTCVSCDRAATKFDSELSKKEFTISGLCQECQNDVFAEHAGGISE